MDKNAFLDKIKEIGTCEDEVDRRELLANLSEDVSKVFDDLTVSTETIASLESTIEENNNDMEKLRQANMNLFKRIGTEKTENEKLKDNGFEEEKPKRKFEDLFNEKGMIKR